jgi:hypothetical protein
MTKYLIVGGCSHSSGAELTHRASQRTEYDLENCFSAILAKKHGFEHINVADSGVSNEFMLSNVVFQVNRLLAEGVESKNILALVGWTSFSREQIVLNGKFHGWTLNSHKSPFWKDRPNLIKKAYKIWEKCVDYEVLNNEHILRYQLLKGFLDSKGISYYFFNAIDHIRIPNSNQFNLDKTVDAVAIEQLKNDKFYRRPFEYEETYFRMLSEKFKCDPCSDGRWYHYREDGHKIWANILDKEMTALGLFDV